MLNAFDYLKAAFSAVRDVAKVALEEQKKKADTSSAVTSNEESEPFFWEHTYAPWAEETYVDPVRNYISPKEYDELPQDRREGIALRNYVYATKFREKSNEEIGSAYERFIAYRYTQMGYHVNPRGILYGKDDGGIDLIAKKGSETLIIQCKYWGRGKQLHENCVTQLYGSCHAYRLEHQNEGGEVSPLLVTNITLDYMAKQTAKRLGVPYMEKYFMRDYPLVKCCTFEGRFGRDLKLYFLPFDEAYDYVNLESKKVSYAFSVEEAVYRGFRRDCESPHGQAASPVVE